MPLAPFNPLGPSTGLSTTRAPALTQPSAQSSPLFGDSFGSSVLDITKGALGIIPSELHSFLSLGNDLGIKLFGFGESLGSFKESTQGTFLETDTMAGDMTREVGSFLLALLGAGKVLKGIPALGRLHASGKLGAGAVGLLAGGISDFAVADPEGPRLANLLEQLNPPSDDSVLYQGIVDYLKYDPFSDETRLQGRLKNTIEGASLGVAGEVLFSFLRTSKSALNIAGDGDPEMHKRLVQGFLGLEQTGKIADIGKGASAISAPLPTKADGVTPFTGFKQEGINAAATIEGDRSAIEYLSKIKENPRFDLSPADLPKGPDANEITWYHGGKTLIDQPNSHVSDIEGLLGSGFYMTDSPQTAMGYARKTGTVTEVKVNIQKTLNMEEPLPEQAIKALRDAAWDDFKPLFDEAAAEGKTGLELWKDLRQAVGDHSSDNWVPKSEYSEMFDDFGAFLREAGFDAMTHVGGLRAGKGKHLHKVLILLDPASNFSTAKKLDVATGQYTQKAAAEIPSSLLRR